MSGASRVLRLLAALALAACADGEAREPTCAVVQRGAPLPAGLEETSGVAASRAIPGAFWSHNDSGGEAALVAVRSDGSLVTRVALPGAKNRDWEDVAVGPCPGGSSCVYVADIGDNDADREDVEIYRLPEPAAGAAQTPELLRVRYPGGPRDAEALFVLPDGRLYLVTKGRNSPVTLYRVPLPASPGAVTQLEPVVELGGRRAYAEMVTAASASPSGRWVGIRTYQWLSVYRTEELLRGNTRPFLQADLGPVGEPQGEGVALLDDGTVVLTGEGGLKRGPGTISVLRCALEE